MDMTYTFQKIGFFDKNVLYFLREDLLPFSFGGNKVRKAKLFFDYIKKNKYDCVITYGSYSSNHARIVSNMAKQNNLRCCIIIPEIDDEISFNTALIKSFGSNIIKCSLNNVKDTIKRTIDNEVKSGYKPYFIEGGGHGNFGTQSYVDAFKNIHIFESENNIIFDYIFLASGTGTTQAGLIIGNKILNTNKKIVGISIARNKEIGRKVIFDSIKKFIEDNEVNVKFNYNDIIFEDSYVCGGYGKYDENIENTIVKQLNDNGIPLDPTYTGKAFYGMENYIIENSISCKNILFIHTGGTPLFFDYLVKRGI